MKTPRHGGSFAPPLDADGLARYRELAAAASDPVRQEMTELCDMLELFWQTPESTQPAQPHLSETGYVKALDKSEVTRIWDSVPYEHECEAISQLFHRVEADKSERNSVKLQQWQHQLILHFYAEQFPGLDPSTVDQAAAFYKRCRDGKIGPVCQQNADALLATAFPSVPAGEELLAKAADIIAKWNAARANPETSPIPRPVLESTELRKAAMHLLWFARCLAADREPITNDKL